MSPHGSSLPLPFSVSQQKTLLGGNALCEPSCCYGQKGTIPWGCKVVLVGQDHEHPFQHCQTQQDQTQTHLLTEVSNKELTPCSGTGITWLLPRTKGTNAAISGRILRQHPGSNRMGNREKQLSNNSCTRAGFTFWPHSSFH